jgi:hypothetical protein
MTPTNRCRWIGRRYADGDVRGSLCERVAVTDGRWPLCEKHRHTRPRTSIQRFNEYVYLRAQQRALLTQAEAFFHIEAVAAYRLSAWRFAPYYVAFDQSTYEAAGRA